MRLKNASFLEYWFQKHLLQFVSLFPANSRKVFRKLAQFRLLYHSKSSTLVKTIKQSFCKNRILVIFTLKVISGKATCNVLQPAFLISTISGVRSGALIGAPALRAGAPIKAPLLRGQERRSRPHSWPLISNTLPAWLPRPHRTLSASNRSVQALCG